MLIPRPLFSPSRYRIYQVANFLQRFGPSRRIQSRSYAKSKRNNHADRDGHYVLPSEEEPLHTWDLYVIPAGIIGFAGLAAFLHYNDERRAVPKGERQKLDRVTVQGPIIGGPFTLINTEGQMVTQKNFLGNWVLLYFGYTSSPDVGPEQVKVMTRAIDKLGKEQLKVLPVFVTIDPQRDNPSHVCAYLQGLQNLIAE